MAVHFRRSAAEADATRAEAESLGVRAVALRADLADREAARALVREAHRELGGLTVLVTTSGTTSTSR